MFDPQRCPPFDRELQAKRSTTQSVELERLVLGNGDEGWGALLLGLRVGTAGPGVPCSERSDECLRCWLSMPRARFARDKPEVKGQDLGPALATYADLEALADGVRGEVIAGQLITLPAPNGEHWRELGVWDDTARVSVRPFEQVELDVARLFLSREVDPPRTD